MEEVNAMLDVAEEEIAEGRTTSHEKSMRRWQEKIARADKTPDMVEAV